MYALVMALEICFAYEFLGAPINSTREGIFALLIVGFQMGFVVVAATKKLATTLNLTLEVGLLL
jgi:hypothetical protein